MAGNGITKHGYFYDRNGVGKIIFFTEATCIHADGNYSIVHDFNPSKTITIAKTLCDVAEEMHSGIYFRSHDAWLTNMMQVKELMPQTDDYSGRYIKFYNDTTAKCQKNCVQMFLDILEGIRVMEHFLQKYPNVHIDDLLMLKEKWSSESISGYPDKK